METPVPSPALRISPPSVLDQSFSMVVLLIVPTIMLFALWMAGSTTVLTWIAPLLWLGYIGIVFVVFTRKIQEPVYWLDANGISFLDRHRDVTQSLAWSGIVEICSGRQDEILLYTRGRERVVKITPNRQNYAQSAPVLAEYLAPLWRELTKKVYDKTFGVYFTFLIIAIFIVVGITAIIQSLFPSIIFIGMGLFFAYHQLKSVRRIQFTSDGMVLTKVYGREIVSAAAIHTIELRRNGRGYAYMVLLRLRDNCTIPLHGFEIDPISLYCVMAVWQRDQLNNVTL